MRTLATIEDFELRYGQVDGDQKARVGAHLEDAAALILSAVEGSEAAWVLDDEEDVPREVVMVCTAMAHRAWTDDGDVVREQLGEYAVTYNPDEPSDIWLTGPERKTVRRAAGLSSGGFRAVTLASPYSGDDDESEGMDFDLEGS